MAVLMRPILLVLLLLARPGWAAFEEYEVKAAVVYHLSLFTEWPAMSPREGPFNLCALTEDDGMAQALGRLNGKTVKGSPLHVWRKRPMSELAACNLIYLGAMGETARHRVVAQMAGLPVLVIANGGIPVAGAMVNIGLAGERVYFDIDLPAAQRSGLRLDARLLRLARSVAR